MNQDEKFSLPEIYDGFYLDVSNSNTLAVCYGDPSSSSVASNFLSSGTFSDVSPSYKSGLFSVSDGTYHPVEMYRTLTDMEQGKSPVKQQDLVYFDVFGDYLYLIYNNPDYETNLEKIQNGSNSIQMAKDYRDESGYYNNNQLYYIVDLKSEKVFFLNPGYDELFGEDWTRSGKIMYVTHTDRTLWISHLEHHCKNIYSVEICNDTLTISSVIPDTLFSTLYDYDIEIAVNGVIRITDNNERKFLIDGSVITLDHKYKYLDGYFVREDVWRNDYIIESCIRLCTNGEEIEYTYSESESYSRAYRMLSNGSFYKYYDSNSTTFYMNVNSEKGIEKITMDTDGSIYKNYIYAEPLGDKYLTYSLNLGLSNSLFDLTSNKVYKTFDNGIYLIDECMYFLYSNPQSYSNRFGTCCYPSDGSFFVRGGFEYTLYNVDIVSGIVTEYSPNDFSHDALYISKLAKSGNVAEITVTTTSGGESKYYINENGKIVTTHISPPTYRVVEIHSIN
ncbi:hypothetical protein [Methanomethylophilus alvi]|uniref:hypothetical protein n=1 Tax=Methanomethylophilus alvi TaxID=1291540 RepID=UPI0037DC53F8